MIKRWVSAKSRAVLLTRWMVHPRLNEIFQGWMNEKGWMKGEKISVAKFFDPLVFLVLPNTYQQPWIKWRTSRILSLPLKQSATYHFIINYLFDTIGINVTERCHILLTWMTESLLCSAWPSCTPDRKLSARIAVL